VRLALAAALVAVAAAAGVAAAQEPEVPTRDCRSRIESGRAPFTFVTADSVVAGPLALGNVPRAATRRGLGPRGEDGRFFVKAPTLVRAGRNVVVSIPERYRHRLFLRYTRSEEGTYAVRFDPCPPATRAFSYPGRVGDVTGFNGGFSLTRPGCYPLDVRVEGGRAYRVRVAFAYPCR
jgi:hypothetical protein